MKATKALTKMYVLFIFPLMGNIKISGEIIKR